MFVEGVPHGADLFYIFGIPYTGVPPYKKQDIEASSLMMTMWSNYVKTGWVVPVRQNRMGTNCTSKQGGSNCTSTVHQNWVGSNSTSKHD